MRRFLRIDAAIGMALVVVPSISAAEQADPEVRAILAAWQKRQQETKAIACKLSGTRTFTQGSYSGLFADGSVRSLRHGTSPVVVSALLTPNGGEPTPEY